MANGGNHISFRMSARERVPVYLSVCVYKDDGEKEEETYKFKVITKQ